MKKVIVVFCLFFLFTGCATYRTTLTNEKGQSIACEASGKSGIITGFYLQRAFEDCIAAAKAQGFREMPNSKDDSDEGMKSK